MYPHTCRAYSFIRNLYQLIDHAPAFEDSGIRHARAVLRRCQSVVGRNGGATPEMANWISDSASTLRPLQISIWCMFPTKKSTLVPFVNGG